MNNNDPFNIFENKDTDTPINNNTTTPNVVSEPEEIDILKPQAKEKEPKKKLNGSIFLSIIFVATFLSVCVLVVKTFVYGEKIDEYEEVFTEIEKKNEESIIVYEGKEIDSEVLKKVAATELISCINSKVPADNLPDSIKNKINEINNYYNRSNNYFAYSYKDI